MILVGWLHIRLIVGVFCCSMKCPDGYTVKSVLKAVIIFAGFFKKIYTGTKLNIPSCTDSGKHGMTESSTERSEELFA